MEVDKVCRKITRMTPEMRVRKLPYLVVKLLTGARMQHNAEGSDEVVAVTWQGDVDRFHVEDAEIAEEISKDIFQEYFHSTGYGSVIDIQGAMKAHGIASDRLRRMAEEASTGRRYRIACLKDTSGSGYWRMVVPSHYISSRYAMDITETGMSFEQLMDYDVVYMQRNHTWAEYYLVERLKEAGKIVVYDIDDDIYHIPPHNVQAFHRMGEDQQAAATAIMGLADYITTPSAVIQKQFGFEAKTIVIPNAVDLADGWPSQEHWGSPEKGVRRILWQGSASHAQDWMLFVEALDNVLRKHNMSKKKDFEVRLLILGYLPPVVQQLVETKTWWSGHVEYQPFVATETYIQTIKGIRADVGIAPLEDIPFNHAKSPLKFCEYSAIGVPVVASDVEPYSSVVQNGVSGFLVGDTKSVEDALEYALSFDKDDKLSMVGAARKKVREDFNIMKVAKIWETVLKPFGQ